MRDALNKTGRPILFSMCNWGVGDSWRWASEVHTACSHAWTKTCAVHAIAADYSMLNVADLGLCTPQRSGTHQGCGVLVYKPDL